MADPHDRVLLELLQELSHASFCLLVSYTPLDDRSFKLETARAPFEERHSSLYVLAELD